MKTTEAEASFSELSSAGKTRKTATGGALSYALKTLGRHPTTVYAGHMSRTNVDIDDEACAEVMRRCRLKTKREAVNFALRALAAAPLGIDEARRLRGSGRDGDLDEMRAGRST